MTNLALWESLEKTDPRHTKEFSGKGGFSGTAINATYILRRLTETFGPCGRGWRFLLEEERIEEGHVLKSGDKAKLHIVRGHLEYYQDGIWYKTSPQFGQTFLVAENKYGSFTDEEAPKKSITDCIGKCAVLLGIGADIHLGMFDDSKYVNQRLAEEEAADGTAPDKVVDRRPRTTGPLPPKDNPANKNAIAFAQKAGEDLKKITVKEQLTAWLAINQAKVDRLKDYDQELADTVQADIIEARTRVT